MKTVKTIKTPLKTKAELVREVEKLRKKNARMEKAAADTAMAYNAISDYLTVIDRNYRIVSYNKAVERQFGKNLKGKICFEVYQGRKEICPGCAVKRSLVSGKPEYTFQPATKVSKPVEIYALPIFDKKGNVIAVLEHGRDVSERIKMEEALRESEEKYRNLFESVTDSLFLVDMNGNFLDVNRTACENFGYTKEEMLSMNITRLTSPEFTSRVPERIEEIRKSGFGVFDSALLKKDGSVMHVEVNARLIDYEGEKAFFSVIRDITERKRVEAALKENEQKFKAFFEGAPDAVFLADTATGIILDANTAAEKLLQRPKDKIIGLHQSELHPAEKKGYSVETFKQHVAGAGLMPIENTVVRPDGSEVPIEVLAHTFKIDGKPVIMGVFRDITEREKAETELRESENRLRTLIDAIPDAIFFKDATGRHIIVNKANEQMFGLTPEMMLGKTVEDIMPPDVAATCRFNDEAVMESRKTVRCEEHSHDTSGKDHILDTIKVPIYDAFGNAAGLVGIVRDITEQKKSEEALKESENRLRTLIDAIPDAIFFKDASGRHIIANTANEAMFGLTPEMMLGKMVEDLLPSDVAATCRLNDEAVMKNKEIVRCEEHSFDKSGNKQILDTIKVPLYDESGNAMGLVGIARDITERTLIEEALTQSEAKLKKAQHYARTGSWTWNIKTNKLEWSDEMFRLFGIDKATFSGSVTDVIERAVHPEDRAKLEHANLSVIKDKKPMPLEYRVVWPDKSEHTVWAEAGEFLLDEAGNPWLISGTVQDITERKKAEEALKESEKSLRKSLAEKELLIKEVHHRVKNNMAIVSSLLQLQTYYISDENIRRVLEESRNRINSMALVHEKLYASRDLTEIDIGEYILGLAGNLFDSYAVDRERIALKTDIENMPLAIDQLIPCGLIINELVTNAIKYAFKDREKGQIKIIFKAVDSERAALVVSDDGAGLPPEMDVSKAKTLGLRLVASLVKQLKGEMLYEGTGGASYSITFMRE